MKLDKVSNFFWVMLFVAALLGFIYWLVKRAETPKPVDVTAKATAVKIAVAIEGNAGTFQLPAAFNTPAQKTSDAPPRNTAQKNSNPIAKSPAIAIPFGSPMVTSINALRAAAKQGDTIAACRVQLELTMCDSYAAYSLEERKARSLKDPKFARYASIRETLCAGLNEAEVKKSGNWRSNFDTAMLGSEFHMQYFAINGPIVDPESSEMAAAVAAWKEFAPTMIKAAADKGVPRALFTLAMEYSGDLSSYSRNFQPQTVIFPPNEEFALFYAYAAIEYFRESSKFDPKWQERIDPEVREKVQAQIAATTLKMPPAQTTLIKQKADEYVAGIIAARPDYGDSVKSSLENFPDYKMCVR